MGQSRGLQQDNLCPCGSGKSFGECCLAEGRAYYPEDSSVPVIRRNELPVEIQLPQPVEPFLDLVPSLVHEGKRYRVLHNTLWECPASETFHEFLVGLVQRTIGIDWWKHQIKLAPENRHPVTKWKFAFSKLTKRHGSKITKLDGRTVFSGLTTGPAWALLMLGYDIYCLSAIDRLPTFIVTKLRDNDRFQSARYELAVAAIMARGNFSIEFLDDHVKNERHCEFIATHNETRTELGVEAKSRRMAGVLNHKHREGAATDSRTYRKGIAKLLKKAGKQHPDNMPFVIFVDMNLPVSGASKPEELPWIDDLEGAIADAFETPTKTTPMPYSVLAPTNFAHYYGANDGDCRRGECGLYIPQFPRFPITERCVIDDIWGSLKRYDRIPAEVECVTLTPPTSQSSLWSPGYRA